MHINLELLECVYLVSAMLLEIPYMAAHEFDARRRMISKQFHHQLRVGERQPLLGECPTACWAIKSCFSNTFFHETLPKPLTITHNSFYFYIV